MSHAAQIAAGSQPPLFTVGVIKLTMQINAQSEVQPSVPHEYAMSLLSQKPT